MTWIFDPSGSQNIVYVDYPEWKKKYGYGGECAEVGLDIVGVFHNGVRRLLPEEVPKRMIAEKIRRPWPDSFMVKNGLLVVREPLRDIIERLDPGVHQFFPLTFHTKRGLEIEGPWFAMNVTAHQSSIVVERSRVVVSEKFPDTNCSFYPSSNSDWVTVDPAAQSGVNLWRETRFYMSLLCSDQLMQEIKAQGLRFYPKSYRATDLNAA